MNNFWQGFFNGFNLGMLNNMFGGFMPCCNYFSVDMPVSVFGWSPTMNYGAYSQPSIFMSNMAMPMSMPTAMPMCEAMPVATNMQMPMSMPVMQNWNTNFTMPFTTPVNFTFSRSPKGKVSDKPQNTGTPTKKTSSLPAATTLEEFRERYGVTEKTLLNGLTVLACRWSRFDKCQKEWLDMQKHILKAAEELGLTVVYSDVERTNAESEAGYQQKGNMVVRRGGAHNHGVAADIRLFKDGKPISSTSDLQRQFAARVKELSGGKITWGGDFGGTATVNGKQVSRASVEGHHFELTNWREKYGGEEYSIG